ncbi:MAG TPA: cytochrome c [Pyrinomonadaceae bacterium]|jgi:mono/diheme cytochrome c family protein|nr:cytochrome c [Pyrinomonadaceae bacterium]
MRKFFKVAVVLSFITFGILGLFSRSFAGRYRASDYGSSRAESTKDVYLQNCARCHGIDGRGQTEQGRKYNVPDLVKETKGFSSAKIGRIITNGKLDMPGFGKKLTKKQITSLTAYVKKL